MERKSKHLLKYRTELRSFETLAPGNLVVSFAPESRGLLGREGYYRPGTERYVSLGAIR